MIDLQSERDERIAVVMDEVLAEMAAGRAIDVAAWQARYPEFAGELPALLDTVRGLDTIVEDWKMIATSAELLFDMPAPAAPAKPQQTTEDYPSRIGRYRILECLGEGGMGTVYQAHDPQLDRVVALKVPRFDKRARDRATAMQRFMREARAAGAIRHPHVCPIYDVGEHAGLPFVVMAYVEGQSLAELLRDGHPLGDVTEAVRLAAQVAAALDAVHAHGIIHRDLKPGNILIDSAGQAVLTDFGLARPEKDVEHLTLEGTALGTPAYMAPEQASGELDRIGPRTDIYSLGVVLYQMLTGRVPFQGPTLKVLSQISHDSPPAPSSVRSDLDSSLEAIVLKAMARLPEDRYQSAKQLGEALNNWLTAQTPLPVLPVGQGGPAGAVTELLPEAEAEQSKPSEALAVQPVVEPLLPDSVTTHRPARTWRSLHERPSTWIAAAAALLVVAVGAYFAPQVVRIVTDKGQIVIETDGAGIEVVIKDQKGTVLDTETKREITFKAGEYNIEVTVKDSGGEQRFVTDHFTLTRNGKKTVDARWEVAQAKPATAPSGDVTEPPSQTAKTAVVSGTTVLPDRAKPFVLLGANGTARGEFKQFAAAVAVLQDGDTIEVYGNGPFKVPAIRVQDKALILRAAPGYRPVFVPTGTLAGGMWFEFQGGALTIEGCHFRCPTDLVAGFLSHTGPKLRVTDCLIWMPGIGSGGVFWLGAADSELRNNIVLAGECHVLLFTQQGGQRVHLQNNTVMAADQVLAGGISNQHWVTVTAESNIFHLPSQLILHPNLPKDRLHWQGRQNLYSGP
ncbi:MAG: serine/threonine protein kinase, partial [Planctomycetes bacterium]|nr:serine/threonine protein kinase [Planctomycetota bacterium]